MVGDSSILNGSAIPYVTESTQNIGINYRTQKGNFLNGIRINVTVPVSLTRY